MLSSRECTYSFLFFRHSIAASLFFSFFVFLPSFLDVKELFSLKCSELSLDLRLLRPLSRLLIFFRETFGWFSFTIGLDSCSKVCLDYWQMINTHIILRFYFLPLLLANAKFCCFKKFINSFWTPKFDMLFDPSIIELRPNPICWFADKELSIPIVCPPKGTEEVDLCGIGLINLTPSFCVSNDGVIFSNKY